MIEHRSILAASILVVDDEEMNVELLQAFLADGGYENVTTTRDSRLVLGLYESVRPDLILLDLHMPHLTGFEVMELLAERIPADELVPIVVLTADITPEARQRALAGGAKDFLNKPLDEAEVLLRIRNLLDTRFLYLGQRAARERAEAGERRAALLSEASRVLGTSLDTQTTLSMLAHLAVPALADLCVVEVVKEDGGFAPIAFAPSEPWAERLVEYSRAEYRGLLGLTGAWSGEGLPAEALRTQTEEAVIVEPAGAAEHPRAATPTSLVWAPLVASGRTIGAITLMSREPERPLGPDALAMARELAQRASFAMENARLYHDAQEATRARDEILAVVAHDLRNPLNTIGLAVSLLQDTVPEGPPHRHLEILARSATRMNGLIQDLLEVTRIETGKLRLELCEQPVDRLLEEAASMLRPLAEARGIRLDVDLPPHLPPARIDPARVMQVISNLVGNSVKFTPDGGRIRLVCEMTGAELRFAVEDSGAGIAPEQLPHVFGRFWQASDADHRGIGLGLSIARGIVEAHGGGIWVESRLGAGTTFFFTLPAAIAGADSPAADDGAADRPASSHPAEDHHGAPHPAAEHPLAATLDTATPRSHPASTI